MCLNIPTSSCVYFAVGNLCSIIYLYNSELYPMGYHIHTGDHYYNPHSCGCATLTGLYFMVLVSGLSVTRATKRFFLLALVYRGQPLLNLSNGGVTMYFHNFSNISQYLLCCYHRLHKICSSIYRTYFFLIFLENISPPLLQDSPSST